MSTQDSTTNSTSGTSQAAEQNASFQQCWIPQNTTFTIVVITITQKQF